MNHHIDVQRHLPEDAPVSIDTEQGRHFSYLGLRVPDATVTLIISLTFAGCLVLSSAVGVKEGAAGFLVAVAAVVLLFPHYTIKACAPNMILFLYPVWALLSIAWSMTPDRTGHSGLLLLVTMLAAVFVGSLPHRREMVTGAWLPFFTYIAYSLAYGSFTQMGSDDTAFAGLVDSKNYFGHLAALTFILSLCAWSWAGHRFGKAIIFLGIVSAAISLLALLQSRATGSTISAGLAFGMFLSIIVYRRLAWPFRVIMISIIAGVTVIFFSFRKVIEEDLFGYVLTKFGKDTTLTGRSTLWDFADRLIAEHPILGHGYNAFWHYSNPDAWTLWRTMGAKPMGGFNFHNTPREVLMDCGWIGLAIFIGTLGIRSVSTAWGAFRSGDTINAVRTAFVIYFLCRMPVETTGMSGLVIDTVLLFGFLCISTGRSRVARNASVKYYPMLHHE